MAMAGDPQGASQINNFEKVFFRDDLRSDSISKIDRPTQLREKKVGGNGRGVGISSTLLMEICLGNSGLELKWINFTR